MGRQTIPQWARILGLATAGVASFALAAALQRQGNVHDADIVQPAQRTATAAQASASSAAPALAGVDAVRLPEREPVQGSVSQDPFGTFNPKAAEDKQAKAASPAPQPPKAPPPAARPATAPAVAVVPTAPPLPFQAIGGIRGQKIGDGKPIAFLRHGEAVLTVKVGDEIDRTYRVESVTHDAVEFTYLPLKQRQTLSLQQ